MSSDDFPEDFLSCYRTLGLRDDESDWRRVRDAYRRLISDWHPDRIEASDLPFAEERAKHINAAYALLADYYRAFGHLPRAVTRAETLAEPSVDELNPAQPGAQNGPAPAADFSPQPIGRHALLRPATWGLVVLVGTYFALHVLTASSPELSPAPSNSVPQGIEPASPTPTARFAVGSTLGEVLSAQGRPSHTDGDTWHYGNSIVQFDRGRVVSWRENPDNPLRTSAALPRDTSQLAFYGVGASRDTVLSIQGRPSRTEGNTWHYGDSKIHFNGDQVNSWDESPLSPLRVRR